MDVIALKTQAVYHHLNGTDGQGVGRISQRHFDVFSTFRNDNKCLKSFIRTVNDDAVILEIFLSLSDEFLA